MKKNYTLLFLFFGLLLSFSSFGQIVANDDTYVIVIPIGIEPPGVGGVLYNDSLNGIANLNTNQVQVNLVSSNAISGIEFTSQGDFVFGNQIPTGIYTVVYQICEVANPNNCATATVTIQVTNDLIIANDDAANYTGIEGGIAFTNVLINDTLHGFPVLASEVIVTMVSTTNPGLTLSGLDVLIAPGTPEGSYTLTYQICEVANPSNCDTAVVTFAISDPTIIANDDFFNTTDGDPVSPPVLVNDTLNGVPILASQVNVTFVSSSNTGITLSGIDVIVAPGTPNGVYSLVYQICELNNPNNCDTALVTILIQNGTGSTTNTGDNINLINYTTPPRPGFVYQNYIAYRNNSNQTIPSGTITFSKEDFLTITSVSQAGSTANANGFTYDFTDLMPNESRVITVSMQVPTIPIVNIGDLVTNTAAMSFFNGTENVSSDSILTQTIVGSYDPNDKTESHDGKIVYSTFTDNDYLTYTIRFENTGTANAENVRVNDFLDSKLDETTVQMVRGSHSFLFNRVNNELNWNFYGINLPPSTPNDAITGHGYIVFQVKPKSGFAIGDIIPNTAAIYFDFNPPIITEPCITEFVNSLSTNQFMLNDLRFYPNPTQNNLSIVNKTIIDSVIVSSVLGQEMISKNVNDLQTEIDLSQLSNGIYFVKATSAGQEKIIKILKE